MDNLYFISQLLGWNSKITSVPWTLSIRNVLPNLPIWPRLGPLRLHWGPPRFYWCPTRPLLGPLCHYWALSCSPGPSDPFPAPSEAFLALSEPWSKLILLLGSGLIGDNELWNYHLWRTAPSSLWVLPIFHETLPAAPETLSAVSEVFPADSEALPTASEVLRTASKTKLALQPP